MPMTEETSPPLASAKVKPQAQRRQWLALLVLLLLIALAVVGWCGWQQLSQEQASLTQSLQQWQSGQRAQRQALQADVPPAQTQLAGQIGRASLRVRVCQYVELSVVAGSLKKKQN